MFRVTALLVMSVMILPCSVLAEQDKQHHDAFVPEDTGESRIAREVRHQLVTLLYYGIFDDLAFRLDGSTVTLVGSVARPVLKSDAGNVVKSIEGVTQVVNQIKVLPPSPMEDQIRYAEYRAIYGDPTLATRYGY